MRLQYQTAREAECRWIKYLGLSRKKHEYSATKRGRGRGTATRSISISLYWGLLHNRYTGAVRGRSLGCIKVSLIFPADRCSNLLRALDRSLRHSVRSSRLFSCSFKRRSATVLSSPAFLTLSIRSSLFIHSLERIEESRETENFSREPFLYTRQLDTYRANFWRLLEEIGKLLVLYSSPIPAPYCSVWDFFSFDEIIWSITRSVLRLFRITDTKWAQQRTNALYIRMKCHLIITCWYTLYPRN